MYFMFMYTCIKLYINYKSKRYEHNRKYCVANVYNKKKYVCKNE